MAVRMHHIFILAALLAGGAMAGDDAKAKPRFFPGGPEIDTLKTELGLSDADIAKIKDALQGTIKKNAELAQKPEVKAAEEERNKAIEALRQADEKVRAARGNFDLWGELRKAMLEAIPEEKRVKAKEMVEAGGKKTQVAPAAK